MNTEKKLDLRPVLISALLLLTACVSIFLFARWASSNAVFEGIHASVDQKTQRVLGLSASSAAISTGISLLPGDAGTPIAEKIADLTGDFLLILCVLYTEKNLLAVIGSVVFRYAIPIACGLLIWNQFREKEILRAQALNEGKPEKIVDRMVEGRIEKYYKENCLMEQAFVKNPDITIATRVNEATLASGEKISIRRFTRYERGEGIEKKESNLADEIAEMTKK